TYSPAPRNPATSHEPHPRHATPLAPPARHALFVPPRQSERSERVYRRERELSSRGSPQHRGEPARGPTPSRSGGEPARGPTPSRPAQPPSRLVCRLEPV